MFNINTLFEIMHIHNHVHIRFDWSLYKNAKDLVMTKSKNNGGNYSKFRPIFKKIFLSAHIINHLFGHFPVYDCGLFQYGKQMAVLPVVCA